MIAIHKKGGELDAWGGRGMGSVTFQAFTCYLKSKFVFLLGIS